MPQPVLVAGARTPIGKLPGSLAALSAPALGGIAVEAALRRAGITGDQVDAVILGNVVQAEAGPNPARLAAARGGIPRCPGIVRRRRSTRGSVRRGPAYGG